MANLNIIGNGFDLFHGLPTSYYYFACYLLSVDEQLYDDLAEMYGFSKGIMHHFTEEIERGIDDVGYWREFEKHLGYLSSLWVENSLVDDLYLEYPDAVDLEIDRPNRSTQIKEMLARWIETTIDTEMNYTIIRKMIGANKVDFSEEDTFISFNYTHTLEKVYNIQKVLHIHGEANSSMFSELIVGHGNDEIIKELGDKISELNIDDFDQPSRNRKIEYQFEKEVLKELRKPVERCRENLRTFISRIDQPNSICVYGFSLGDVDIPYLQLIREQWAECKWHFSYHSESDKTSIERVAKILKIDIAQYDMFRFNNLHSRHIEDILLKENKIVVFPTISKLMKKRKTGTR